MYAVAGLRQHYRTTQATVSAQRVFLLESLNQSCHFLMMRMPSSPCACLRCNEDKAQLAHGRCRRSRGFAAAKRALTSAHEFPRSQGVHQSRRRRIQEICLEAWGEGNSTPEGVSGQLQDRIASTRLAIDSWHVNARNHGGFPPFWKQVHSWPQRSEFRPTAIKTKRRCLHGDLILQ